jgi:soluble lytic murein transglycosylase-like protein
MDMAVPPASERSGKLELAADPDRRGGCAGFLVPPLAVILLAMAAISLAVRPPSKLALASIKESTSGGIAAIFTPEVQFWAAPIQRWASAAGVDANLAAVVMEIESCGDPFAVSRSGAMGLFQVMPYHFAVSEDPFSPDANAGRGLGYLKQALIAAQGDVRLALAGYNGGIGVITRREADWPAETQRYVYWGGGIFADAVAGKSSSMHIEEWLAAAGRLMCQGASRRLGISG